MAVDTPSIARPLAPAPSLNYEQLFLEGIQHIEKLSGKIWTDYNAHDPGITILEVLSYAITELGYRCDYEMGDLVEPSPESAILNDFFSLANIATNAPLTIDDFRKLLIDIEGNRNAWLEKVTYEPVTGQLDDDPNAQLFYHKSVTGSPDPILNNIPEFDPLLGKQIKIKGLYDVFLQFDEHPEFGDLNDNSLKATLDMQPIGFSAAANFDVEFEFPIWETIPEEADKLFDYLENGVLPTFTVHLPVAVDPVAVTGEEFVYEFLMEVHFTPTILTVLSLPLSVRLVSGQDSILNHNDFRNTLRSRLYPDLPLLPHSYSSTSTTQDPVVQIVLDFIYRRQAIKELLETSRLSLANHRNLCEDFRAVYPMSLQEIGLDLDLDIAPGTDCESVMARVYYVTQQYLSPVIRFYSLREMLEKGYTPEQIFRGPWLLNGFIDENDLSFYQRREILYTSDLVQEFMKIEGVRAVNYIAFSRYQFGKLADKDGVLQQRLTECLCLINPARYLPRLNFDRSNILMNCGVGKPSQPNMANALKLLSEQNAIDNLKGKAPQGDFEIPKGIYSHLGEYHSIQHEFPLNYAIGIEGLAPDETDLRKAQAQQLKGYLLFFEQLLGNFLAQVENLRKLFSFSDDIDRTYFTQALYMVPRVGGLIRDFTENHEVPGFDFDDYLAIQDPNSDYYALKLDALAERNPVFLDRRKRFLDHLVARFGESFSEYAAYVFGRGLTSAEKHGVLIKDQARFLRNYVMHSHDRGTGFNYQRSLEVSADLITDWYWRAGLDIESLNQQSGEVEPLPNENPNFVDPIEEFEIYQDTSNNYRFRLHNANGLNMLHSITGHALESDLIAELELVIAQGQNIGNYTIGSPTTTTIGAIAKVGTAFINSYGGDANAAVEALIGYLQQLVAVDEMPVENEAGHALWQGVNDVTGIKKRMVFLTGLPNVNRQYINPFSRFDIIDLGGGIAWSYELSDDEGNRILKWNTGTPFATEAAAVANLNLMFENLASLVMEIAGSDVELRTVAGDPSTVVGIVEPDFVSAYPGLSEATAAMVAYLEQLYNIENLHVVEHILLRQHFLNEPTLKARRDEHCPALDIEDPYSFRISVILPKWAGRFKEQSFRTMFKRLMRAEVPAHVYIHFYWIDPLQMYNFEQHWAAWLEGGWVGIEGIMTQDQIDEAMVTCLNGLKNLLDAQYVIEPPKIIDEYTLCEVIAAPYDPDGDIVKAWLAPGYALPRGLCLDPCSGAIKVIDKNLLDDDNPIVLQIITINAGGEETWHDITLGFIANGNAVVDAVVADKFICAYFEAANNGESLLTYRDSDVGGSIVEASYLNWTRSEPAGTVLQSGTSSPPNGMSFNLITGEIKVVDYTLLLSGIYEFEVLLQDNSGGFTILHPTFTILPDHEAVAAVASPLNEDAYAVGTVLATITDPDGALTSVVEAGILPSFTTMGLAFNSTGMPANMKVIVANATTFHNWLTSGSPAVTIVGWTYQFTLHLKSQDHCNGKTDLDVLVTVNRDHEAIFIPVPTINVSLHYVGSALGRITDVADGGLVTYNLAANNAVLNPKGIEMYMYTAIDPDEARLRVLNKANFVTAINTATADVNHVATLVIPLQTKDATGGLSTVNAIIKAKQDLPPVVTVSPAANVDSYALYDVLATIEDSDGTGISSATHVVNGFTLASIGMQLRYQGGYIGYSNSYQNSNFNRNLGNFRMGTNNLGSNQQSQNNYQALPGPLFYQAPTDRYVEIVVSNVGLFRQAVMTNPAYTVVDPNTHRVRVSLVINTTDSEGGFASNAVDIEIFQDVEATMTEVMNGERIDDILGGHIMLRFEDLDPNTVFTNATVSPDLTKAFGKFLGQNTFDIYVANKSMLTPGTWPLTVTLEDNAQGQTQINVDLKVLPRLVKANFTVAATQQGHILNLDSKVSGLKMVALNPPYLPKSFGSIYVNNGLQIGFDEGSSYGTSNYSMTVGFTGIITKTNETVDGELTIGRQVVKSNVTTNKGLELLSGNTLVNSKTTNGDAQLRKLSDATGSVMAGLNDVTYYPDNPVLRSNPALLADYAAGAKDAEVTNAMKSLAEATTKEVLRLQETMRTTQGAAKQSASQSLEVYAEILRVQVMTAIHYAGNIRENDFATDSVLASLFESYRQLLTSIFEGKISNVAFTELAKLRGTLRDAQDHFDTLKPNLNAAVLALMPVAPDSQFSGIEAQLPSPHSGEISADVATLLGIFRDAFAEIDELLVDPDFRKRWREGDAVPEVDAILREPITYLTTYIKNAETRIKELPYGIQQLDLAHAHARAADLLNVASNAIFEHLDQLPNEIQGTQPLIDLTDFLGQQFNTVSAQPALAEFRNVTASWTSKWPLKPMLSAPTGASLEVAILEMQPKRVLDRYKNGDSLGAVVMKSGTLASISISKGLLPRGLSLSNDGKILVSDVSLLMVGIFGGLEISGTNDRGFAFTLVVPDIEFYHGSDTTYYVEPPHPLDYYVDGMLLAYPSDPDGEIASAQVQSGTFPPGVRFDTETGNFSVAKAEKLVAGSYDLTVLTEDMQGGLTTEDITIIIGSTGPTEISRNYPNIQLPVNVGDVLATVDANGIAIVSWIGLSGRMPIGTEMNASGEIRVNDNEAINVGTSSWDILATGADQLQYLIHITMEIVSIPIDVPISLLGIPLQQTSGTVLLVLEVTGETITSFSAITFGSLPPGLVMSSIGEIIVDVPSDLQPGQYYFEVHGYTNTHADYLFKVTMGFATSRPPISWSVSFEGVELPLFADDIIGVIDVKGIALSNVKVVSGVLPTNTSVQQDGTIMVGLGQGRVPGTYTFVVTGVGTDLNDYEVTVLIELVDLVPSRAFNQVLSAIKLPVRVNDVVGQIISPAQALLHVEVISGTFPGGLKMLSDGSMVVLEPQLVRAGRYAFEVLCLGDDGNAYVGHIEVEVVG